MGGSASRAAGVDLDDARSYEGLDPVGMVGFAMDLPSHVVEASDIGRRFEMPAAFRNPANIVLAGMGGSAVAGDFLARLCEEWVSVPFAVSRNYEIPGFVGPKTLFIASSHSGDTEETRAAVRAALRRKARILCITTGGKLSAFARRHREDGVALLAIPRKDPRMPPRAALGYSLIPLVRALESLGLYPGAGRHISEAVSLLAKLRGRVRPKVAARRNRAKRLAAALFGKVPWVHGTAGIMSAAAYRWRTQLNENSKTLAYSSECPELNHNEVVGWERAERLPARIEVVMLRRPGDHWRNRARVDIVSEKLVGPKAPVQVIEAEGRSGLAQLLWTVYLGDWTSLYLAFLNGVDPASIDSINTLKRALARLKRPRK